MSESSNLKTIFFAAAKRGSVPDMDDCRKKGQTNANIRDEFGNTALHWSCGAGHLEAVKFLVEQMKADKSLQNKIGDTPLHKAAWRGCLACVKYLADQDVDMNIKNNEGQRPVDLAKHLEVKSYLQSFEPGSDDDDDNNDDANEDEESEDEK